MKKAKILIIILIIILTILGVFVFSKLTKEKDTKEWAETRDENMEIEIEEHIIPVKGHDEFFMVEKLVNNYYIYLKMGNEEAVYSVLSDSYKNKNRISESNALEIVRRNNFVADSFRAREIYYKDNLSNPIYLVYGVAEKDGKGKEVYYLVYLDKEMNTYSIEPIKKDYFEKYRLEKKDINTLERININKYNKYFQNKNLNEEELVVKYFDTWIRENLYYTEYAYSKLDTEYRKLKFPNYSDYRIYIEGQKEKLFSMLPESMKKHEDFSSDEEYANYLANYKVKGINKHKIDKKEEYVQYTLIDDYENYYIMRIYSPMNYAVILDTYTVDLPEFIEKYEKANNEGKMQLNLVKIFSAINAKDYNYAYKKLNETYRKNNFPRLADFEKYVKENFYENNIIGVNDFKAYDYILSYEVTIKNSKQPNATYSNKKKFTMSLGEGTNFEYSFNK